VGKRGSSLWAAGLVVLLLGSLGAAFAAGRSSVYRREVPDPVRLDHGVAVGVVKTRGGALAAADNYVATGISASVDPGQLRQFAQAVIEPGERDDFVAANQSLGQGGAPAVGAQVVANVVADRLESYNTGSAEVAVWVLASEWGRGVAPTQYSAVVDVWQRWTGDHWQIASLRESLPGPVPALVAGVPQQRYSAVWDQTLSGMSSPFYGDS
jgi:hypothetical protein